MPCLNSNRTGGTVNAMMSPMKIVLVTGKCCLTFRNERAKRMMKAPKIDEPITSIRVLQCAWKSDAGKNKFS